ncbi:tyrosine-type recombinase/integrase [Microbacterium sp. cf332]|uniref:tyrosine-type recombinase/integrase n=1 Tax=Microbacterium sp. cf332 TaxID=1761804 RepID=UPI000B88E2D4
MLVPVASVSCAARAADLGLRYAEVAGLHSTDLRERDEEHSLRVRGKGSMERIVLVPADLARAIRVRGAGFLFPGDYNGHISPHYLGKRVNHLLPAGVTMHMLRRRFATIAYNVEQDTFTVQRLLGHASPATTQIYVDIHDDTLRPTVEAVSAHQGTVGMALARVKAGAAGTIRTPTRPGNRTRCGRLCVNGRPSTGMRSSGRGARSAGGPPRLSIWRRS